MIISSAGFSMTFLRWISAPWMMPDIPAPMMTIDFTVGLVASVDMLGCG